MFSKGIVNEYRQDIGSDFASKLFRITSIDKMVFDQNLIFLKVFRGVVMNRSNLNKLIGHAELIQLRI